MSATINFRRWNPVSAETDAQVKQDITGTAAALALPSDARQARLTFEKNAASEGGATPIARFYRHGTNPTASNGIPIYDGETRDIFSLGELKNMVFISADGNTQTVYCQFIAEG